jgi:hypothetical protein
MHNLLRTLLCGALVAAFLFAPARAEGPQTGKLEFMAQPPEPRVAPGGSFHVIRLVGPEDSAKGLVHAKALTGRLGPLLIALDADSPEAETLNIVRVIPAPDGKADFTDAVTSEMNLAADDYTHLRMGPAVVKHQGRDLPFQLHLVVRMTNRSRPSAYGSTRMASQARVAFGRKIRQLCIVNTDPRPQLGQIVQIATTAEGLSGPVEEYFLDQPILVDGQWFQIRADIKKMTVRAVPVQRKTGRVKCPAGRVALLLQGPRNAQQLAWSRDGSIAVASGSYRVRRAWLLGPAPKGKTTGPVVSLYMPSKQLTIREGKTARLDVRLPLVAKTRATLTRGSVRVNVRLEDAAGNRVVSVVLSDGQPAPPPKVRIVDPDGKVVHTATLEYG